MRPSISPTLSALSAIALLSLGCTTPADRQAEPQARQLHLYNWPEYIDPTVIVDFEREFDCKVVQEEYQDNEELLAKLEAGGTSRYDIVVPSDYIVPTLIRKGLLAPLRQENIPNLSNLEVRFTSPAFDPGNRHTAAFSWGTTGLYVRERDGKLLPETWALIFDPALQPGPFLLMDSMREMMAPALRYLGHDVNTVTPSEIAAARDLLRVTAKRAAGWSDGVLGTDKVADGSVTLAVVYSGDALKDSLTHPGTRYFVPQEGSEVWLDSMAIPAAAPNRDLAEQFINFILDGRIGGRVANFNRGATPNRLAKPWVRPEDLKNRAIYPGREQLETLQFLSDLGPGLELYEQAWNQVKKQAG